MNYNEFIEEVRTCVQSRMGDACKVEVHKVTKNNGLILDGITITKKEVALSPTIYLNAYFQQHEDGMEISEITSDLMDFEAIQDRIVYKLIRRQGNELLLSDIPFLPYLNLAVVYYLLLEVNELGQITTLIHNDHLRLWNVEQGALHYAAETNTVKLLPVSFQPIWDVMSEIADNSMENENAALQELLREEEETVNHPLFVLSNTIGVQGADCMLYEDILKKISEKWNSNIVILPSSTHEVLLLPYADCMDFEEFREMVEDVNSSSVPEEDILSNHIYVYKREDGNVHIAL